MLKRGITKSGRLSLEIYGHSQIHIFSQTKTYSIHQNGPIRRSSKGMSFFKMLGLFIQNCSRILLSKNRILINANIKSFPSPYYHQSCFGVNSADLNRLLKISNIGHGWCRKVFGMRMPLAQICFYSPTRSKSRINERLSAF